MIFKINNEWELAVVQLAQQWKLFISRFVMLPSWGRVPTIFATLHACISKLRFDHQGRSTP